MRYRLRTLLIWTIRWLRVAAICAAVAGGGWAGAAILTALVSCVGIKPNVGISLIGIGIGGLVGFMLLALTQLPRRSN